MARMSWKAVAAGAALAALVVLAARMLLAPSEPVFLILLEALALVLGGLAAALLAGCAGVGHGIAVAVVYILISTAFQGWQEFNVASTRGPDAVESINLLDLIVTDLTYLGAGAVGGLLARRGGLPSRH